MNSRWCFNEAEQADGIRLGDRFKVSSTIAILYNDAFVLKNGKIDSKFYYINNSKIEVDLIKKAASPKGKKYCKYEEYIIFPYYFDNDGMLKHYIVCE